MQEEFDAPIWPASLEMLAALRARYPDPLTEADKAEEMRRSTEQGHPIRVVRIGVNRMIVRLHTVQLMLRQLQHAVAAGYPAKAKHLVREFGGFVAEHGEPFEQGRWSDLATKADHLP